MKQYNIKAAEAINLLKFVEVMKGSAPQKWLRSQVVEKVFKAFPEFKEQGGVKSDTERPIELESQEIQALFEGYLLLSAEVTDGEFKAILDSAKTLKFKGELVKKFVDPKAVLYSGEFDGEEKFQLDDEDLVNDG